MRNLVVAVSGHLAPAVTESLLRHSWSLTYVDSVASVHGLDHAQDYLVGLAVFPESRDPAARLLIHGTMLALPAIKWIAAFEREDLDDPVMKRLIADRVYDFQVFPLSGERLTMALGHAHGMAMIEREVRRTEESEWPVRLGLIGDSPVMRRLFHVLQRAAESDVAVLITGPTGTGKDKAAHAIHEHSARSSGPFVALNCAAIPPSLLQAELFGHAKGAFTDAFEKRIGQIETANGGTLFLDEIGDMPLHAQATLLRFLDNKSVTPLGSTQSKEADVRVLASTNKDLEAAIRKNEFRADLFYRLAVLHVRTPPLCEREDDIEQLAKYFLEESIASVRGATALGFSPDALVAMRHYAWPGNVRELRSCVLQAVIHSRGRSILPEDLHFGGASRRNPSHQGDRPETLEDTRNQSEKRRLELSLALNGSNITQTAKDLKISRMTLYRLMEKHGIARHNTA